MRFILGLRVFFRTLFDSKVAAEVGRIFIERISFEMSSRRAT